MSCPMPLAILACAASLAALPAQAQNVRADQPMSVAEAMVAAGLTAELGLDKGGDPKITASSGKQRFGVYFYGCKENKDCKSISFSYGIDLEKPVPWAQMNDFNKNRLFVQAYPDSEFDPWLQMDVNLAFGGLSQSAFAARLKAWTDGLSAFRQMAGL